MPLNNPYLFSYDDLTYKLPFISIQFISENGNDD